MDLRFFCLSGISIHSHILLSVTKFYTVKGNMAKKHLATPLNLRKERANHIRYSRQLLKVASLLT